MIYPCVPITMDYNNNDDSTGQLHDHQSSVKFAVITENVRLDYRSSGKFIHALNGVSLHVPTGHLYGLLGPSGCGKTSILKIICGLLRHDNGEVRVFGYKPRESGSGVPGPGIGYMPQEMALLSNLKVAEILSYFGRLNFMSKDDISQQTDQLLKLLDIPEKNRLISRMSTGQQRRLSLACAILHKPRLAILDEPTVGTDPLLCSEIWKLLQTLTTESQMTIIITTHYIEEARKAQLVSFMRKGQILEEDWPSNLIERFNANSLEGVFYQICLKKNREDDLNEVSLPCKQVRSLPYKLDINRYELVEPWKNYRHSNPIKAFLISINVLIWRYLIQAIREPINIFTLFISPFVSFTVIFTCIGPSQVDLPVAWVVEEEPQYGILHVRPENYSIAYSRYLTPFYPEVLKENLDRKILDLRNYPNLDTAMEDMRALKVEATIYLKRGFSDGFHERINMFNMEDLDDVTIDQGTINLFVDRSDLFTMITIEQTLRNGLLKSMKTTASAMDMKPEIRRLPIELGHPVFGNVPENQIPDQQIYSSVGFIICIVYGCSLGLAALAMSMEQSDNMFERNFSTGISFTQIMIAQTVARSTYLIVDAFLILVFCVYIFKIPCEGSFWMAFGLLSLQTLTGQMTGIILGVLFPDLGNLIIIIVGLAMTIMFAGGIFWPLESLPYFIRWFSLLLPFTAPALSLRNILLKKGAHFVSMVLPGFLISTYWTVFCFITSYTVFKVKHKI